MLRLPRVLLGLALAPLVAAAPATASAPIPSNGYYGWYAFDCTECGGAYGTWEVDLHVAKGAAFFTHVGAKCNEDLDVYFDFTKKQGKRAIDDAKVSINRPFVVDGQSYTVKARLRWVTKKKAEGFVVAGGDGCTEPKKTFEVTVS